jgi:hypothetical protein
MPSEPARLRWILVAATIVAVIAIVIAIPYFGSGPADRTGGNPTPSSTVAAAAPAPAAAPSAAPAAAPDAAPAASPTAPLAWTLPDGWSVIPTQTMRLASFSAGEGATCGLFLFQGGGDRLANVNRWRGQAGLPPLDEPGLDRALTAGTGGFGGFNWLAVRGASKAFLAAIVPTPSGQAFVKLEAPGDRLDALQPGFLAFTASLRAP